MHELNGFQADFAFVLGVGFADPDHVAAYSVELVLIQNDFDNLAAPQMELPRSRKPSLEESRTRQGSLFWLRSRLMTRLARLFDISRFERRPSGTGKLGILSPPGLEMMMRPDQFHLKCRR